MTQYGFYFDSARCTGCRTCEMACKDYKDLDQTTAFRTVYDYEGGTWSEGEQGTYTTDSFAYHLSLACNHCSVPACLGACPQGAIKKADDGIVFVDEEACVGVGACVTACPYNVPIVSPETNIAIKCNFCQERIVEGLAPICVEACPLRALEFGDIEDLRAKYGTNAAIAPMPTADQTDPNIVINPCPAAKEPGDTTGEIANVKEVTGTPAFV